MQNASTVSKLFAGLLLAGVFALTASPLVASANTGHDHDEEASCWISANPNNVYEGGSTTLTWGSENADDAWLSDLGDVGVSGSRIVYNIDEDTTFTLTVENEEGTAECETEVEVRSYGYTGGSNKTPGCTLYRDNAWGSGVLLRWNTTNATSANLSGVGSVGLSGSQIVNPAYDTTYTLTVYGNGKTSQCEIEIDRGYSIYTPHASYPNYTYGYPYVSLTQIPYTVTDLGVVGTAVYFLALLTLAAAGAYLLAYYQGGVLRFSFANDVKLAMRNQARAVRSIFLK